MAPPTAKERYDRLYAQLAEQHKGVASGATSRVNDQQLEQLARLQDEWSAELGLTASGGDPMGQVQKLMDEVQKREAAVAKREAEVERRESEFQQQEVVLESFREELELWRAKDGGKGAGKGSDKNERGGSGKR